jgi:glycosyltransferase involved in cell wall biosynthesis
MARSIALVIPALNEERTLPLVIDGVRKYVRDVIVVDDGSTDRTVEVARKSGAVVHSNPKNLGPEQSCENGFRVAKRMGAEIVVTFDADGQHKPEDIPRFLEPVLNGQADIVVGNRGTKARITEYLFSAYANLRMGIHDPICGLKAIRMEVYDRVGYFDTVKGITAQLLFQAKKKGFRVMELPIEVDAREDTPRFGRTFKANIKIFYGLIKVILNDIGVLS